MKFYDRTEELKVLRVNQEQAKKTACFTMMTGRRRIGKTSLLLESVKRQKHLYLFVSRKSEGLLCAQFQKQARESLGLEIYGSINRLRDFFELLLKHAEKEHYTLIIDEFQEFERINPSIFSDLQDLWDRYETRARINLVVCGSIYSLMMNIFENRKEPLFGRLNSKIILRPFRIDVIKQILHDHHAGYDPEDLLCLYMITGGVAKYVTLFMEAGAVTIEQMLDTVTRQDSPFLPEGKDLLVSEFGKEYGIYFSILQLIAAGKTSQSEIDSVIGKNTGAYLENLEKNYSLITRKMPMFSKPGSRNNKWTISDNYLRFWFRFIFPNQPLLEMGRNDLLRKYIVKYYTQYSGMVLEKYFREKVAQTGQVTDMGSFWDRKGENEIDLIALNKLDKTAIIGEVKRNPEKLDLIQLKQKTSVISKDLSAYKVELKGFSINDM